MSESSATDSNPLLHLEDLDEPQLAMLVDAAISVLSVDSEAPDRLAELPRTELARQLASALEDNGLRVNPSDTAHFLSTTTPRELVIPVLQSLAAHPQIASEIRDAYVARRDMMFIDAGLVAAGALLLLVLKLRRVRAAKGEVDIDFYQAKLSALDTIRKFLLH